MNNQNSGTKLEPSDIPLIKALRHDGMKLREIAEKFEVTTSQVYKIVKGKAWTNIMAQAEEKRKEFEAVSSLKCYCGQDALIIEDGVAECGTCWAQFKEQRKNLINL